MTAVEELTTYRRALHQIPELAMQEFQTHAYLLKQVRDWQTPFMTIREVPELPTALFIYIEGTAPKRTIGYRADIDALPLDEATGLPFASQHPGVMHACGHDVHMSLALGLVHYFAEHQPSDNLVFFFQPAEEDKSGGKVAYDLGLFEGEWRPDEFYAVHDQPSLPAGTFSTRIGTLFAGTAELYISIQGVGGHAAYPNVTKDPIVVAAQLISTLQTVVSRNVDPIKGGVVTIGSIHGGTRTNIIPEQVDLQGTIRSLTQSGLQTMIERVQTIVAGVASAFDVVIDLRVETGSYLPVENEASLTQNWLDFFAKRSDIAFVPSEPAMTGEDFGYLLQQIPGTMLWLGVDDVNPLHSPHLNIDEAALWPGFVGLRDFLIWRMEQI